MPWVILAVVLCILVWYWPRHTLIGLACAAVLGLGVGAALWGYSVYGEHEKGLISLRVETAGVSPERDCAADEVLVSVTNGTGKVVTGLRFSLSAYREGHSANLAKGNWYDDDHIVVPGDTAAFCRKAPVLVRDAQGGGLVWKATLIKVLYAD